MICYQQCEPSMNKTTIGMNHIAKLAPPPDPHKKDSYPHCVKKVNVAARVREIETELESLFIIKVAYLNNSWKRNTQILIVFNSKHNCLTSKVMFLNQRNL